MYVSFIDTDLWPESFDGCIGKRQSPIDIPLKKAKGKAFEQFVFGGGFFSEIEGTLFNNGHTCEIDKWTLCQELDMKTGFDSQASFPTVLLRSMTLLPLWVVDPWAARMSTNSCSSICIGEKVTRRDQSICWMERGLPFFCYPCSEY